MLYKGPRKTPEAISVCVHRSHLCTHTHMTSFRMGKPRVFWVPMEGMGPTQWGTKSAIPCSPAEGGSSLGKFETDWQAQVVRTTLCRMGQIKAAVACENERLTKHEVSI